MPWPFTPEFHCCTLPPAARNLFSSLLLWAPSPKSPTHLHSIPNSDSPSTSQGPKVYWYYYIFTDPQPIRSLHFVSGIKFCGPSLWSFSCIWPQFPCFYLPLLFSPGNLPTWINPPLFQHCTCICEAHYSWRKALSSANCSSFTSKTTNVQWALSAT